MSQPANADVRSIWASWYQPVRSAIEQETAANQNLQAPAGDNDNDPPALPATGSVSWLVELYRADPISPYAKVRFASRRYYDCLCKRLIADHGGARLAEVKVRDLMGWHEAWVGPEKHIALAHSMVGMLRTVTNFGATFHEDGECLRIASILRGLKFPMAKPRSQRLTAEQADAIRQAAHSAGKASIAMAQAFQFEGILRQKDVIGEWVPLSEKVASDVIDGDRKWLRGIRWNEIDDNLVLTHLTSKRQKKVTVDLKLAPMVVDELSKLAPGLIDGDRVNRHLLPASGPIVVHESSKLPWVASYFRQVWRALANECGIDAAVFNMDSRAGAITEATEAGAELEHVKHAATHSNINMTERYSRAPEQKTANVQRKRIAHRAAQTVVEAG